LKGQIEAVGQRYASAIRSSSPSQRMARINLPFRFTDCQTNENLLRPFGVLLSACRW
jgi:hypothetical protein